MFHRLPIVPFALVIIQFCCGAFSGYQSLLGDLDQLLYSNLLDGRSVRAYYVAMACFGVSAAVTAFFMKRFAVEIWLKASAALVLLGYIITAIAVNQKTLPWICIGFGGLQGVGIGISYIISISIAYQHCPGHFYGLCGGLLAVAFGFGSIAGSKAFPPAADNIGLSSCFFVLGAAIAAVLLLMSFVPFESLATTRTEEEPLPENPLQSPKGEFHAHLTEEPPQKYGRGGGIVSIDFLFLYIMLFGQVVYGVTMLSRYTLLLATVFSTTGDNATRFITTLGFFNVLGRFGGSLLSDVAHRFLYTPMARKVIFLAALILQVILIYLLPNALNEKNLNKLKAYVYLLNVCVGAGYGTLPAFVIEIFGPKSFDFAFGVIITAWSAAVVIGGAIFTSHFNQLFYTERIPIASAYISNIKWLQILTVIGLVACILVRTSVLDRVNEKYRYQYSINGVPLIQLGRCQEDTVVASI
ncbi:Major Facilitator Superfamily (MFS) [Thraustotheca clavata]|uniref:Major Facilitator Superfamily (MFS) n=1 Tax=Thraustotheca clavata TaxID=74557 RepID=A0A1V9Y832_9STRA|nr:Major Facilitator Superfamily (MFS) [Thraustotheca clavata]